MTGPELIISGSQLADVGGIGVHRSLPRRGRRMVGAWCFADRFGPIDVTPDRTMTVGPHPHIGLHTVTWLLEGELLHSDSLGNEQPIRPGQLNLMTAGRGIAYVEDARGHRGSMDGVQLWIAQPESTRYGAPSFAHHADQPHIDLLHGQGTILLGEFAGYHAPAITDSAIVGVEIAGRGVLDVPLEPAFEYGVIVLRGTVRVGDAKAVANELLYLGTDRPGLAFFFEEASRILLLGGAPFPEEIAMWWNFVARDRAELARGYADWNDRTERFGPVTTSLHRIEAPRPFWL